MGNMLNTPITNKDTVTTDFSCGKVGVSGMQGYRLEMEDTHVCQKMPSHPEHLYLCVFDGHGGTASALYAERHIVDTIENTSEWKEYIEKGCVDPELLGRALQVAFLELDDKIYKHLNGNAIRSERGGGDISGCTASTCMITPTHFVCANAGDSRTVLGVKGKAIPLSVDHKPQDHAEHSRIVNAGGTVQWNRVDGDLAVSRALGDFDYKKRTDLDPRDQKVSCYPDICIVGRTDEDEVLLLACDGLWDVFSSEEAIAAVRDLYLNGEEDAGLIAEELLDVSLNKGSKDNISAVVVKLCGAQMGPIENGGVLAIRAQRQQLEDIAANHRK